MNPRLHPHRHLRRATLRAFTLIELLTVIAIIGILAAIIIPVVGKVRTKAREAQAFSNLRQIGSACVTYATDNRGNLPWGKLPDSEGGHYWPLELNRFFGGQPTWENPSTLFLDPSSPLADQGQVHFGCNPVLMPEHPFGGTDMRNLARTTRHSQVVLFGDGAQRPGAGSDAVLWGLDGGWWSWEGMFGGASMTQGDNPINAGPDEDSGSGAGQLRFRANGKAKVVFLDGHVAALAPAEILKRNINPLYR